MLSKIKIIVLLLILLQLSNLYSYEVILDYEIEEVSGIDVAMIPFTGSQLVEPEIVKEIFDNVIKQFIKDGIYRPVSINTWLEANFNKNVFSTVDRLLTSIVRGRMPITKLCWANIDFIDGEYLLTFYWYNVRNSKKTMYQRYFRIDYNKNIIVKVNKGKPKKPVYVSQAIKNPISLEEFRSGVLREINTSIFKEFKNRNEKGKALFNKSLLIKKTKVSYYLFSDLSTGDEGFSPVPFLQYGETPLKDGEDFFSNLFEYAFNQAGAMNEVCDQLGGYLKVNTPLLNEFNYVVESELKISNKFSILKIKVINPKLPLKSHVVMTYDYPIKDIRYPSLQEIANKNSQLILLGILNSQELKKIGTLNILDANLWSNNDVLENSIEIEPIDTLNLRPDYRISLVDGSDMYINKEYYNTLNNFSKRFLPFGTEDPIVYINKKYYGLLSRISTHILPFGSNDIILNNRLFKVFISPYWMNDVLFNPTNSILMEKE